MLEKLSKPNESHLCCLQWEPEHQYNSLTPFIGDA